MDLPLELVPIRLERTPDSSTTRLKLDARTYDCVAWLDVQDVQDLASALLTWLDDCGHELPAPPAGWLLVPQQLDEDEDEDRHPTPETVSRLAAAVTAVDQ